MRIVNCFPKSVILFMFLFSGLTFAQKFEKGILIDRNDKVVEGRFFIDDDSYKVIQKEKGVQSEYFFSDIKSFQRDDIFYKEIIFDEKSFFVKQIISGKANLYQLNETEYFVEKER